MPRRLDRKDERILHALSLDARQSLSAVGRKAGLSEEVVNYRLRNLVDDGVIAKFRADVNASRLGRKSYGIYIRLEGADAGAEKEVFDYLSGLGRAYWTGACEGRYNLLFRFFAEDEFELSALLDDLYSRFSHHLRERDVTIPLESHFYPGESGVYIPGKPKYNIPSRRGVAKLDEKDLQLLAMLADDGRAASTQLALKVGLTPNAVRYRLKRLEGEGVITGYQLVADRAKLGMCHYKLLVRLQKANEASILKFARHCESIPNLVFLTRSVGAWDMDLDFDFRNIEELHNAVLGISSKFSTIIKSHETLSVFRSKYSNPLKKQ